MFEGFDCCVLLIDQLASSRNLLVLTGRFSDVQMIRLLLPSLLIIGLPVFAFDSGPRVVACDYQPHKKKVRVSDVCLKNSIVNMGVESVSYEPIRSKKIFRFSTNEPWASKKAGITQGKDGRPLFYKAIIESKRKVIWQGTFEKFTKGVDAQCRPGGTGASARYKMSSGEVFCAWEK